MNSAEFTQFRPSRAPEYAQAAHIYTEVRRAERRQGIPIPKFPHPDAYVLALAQAEPATETHINGMLDLAERMEGTLVVPLQTTIKSALGITPLPLSDMGSLHNYHVSLLRQAHPDLNTVYEGEGFQTAVYGILNSVAQAPETDRLAVLNEVLSSLVGVFPITVAEWKSVVLPNAMTVNALHTAVHEKARVLAGEDKI